MSTWLPTRRPGLRTTLAIVATIVVAIGGAWYWIASGRTASTENAYVNARVVQVSSLVMGQVVEVPVRENSVVAAGDVLFVIDPRPFRTALAEAEGRLRLAEQGTRADTSEVAAASADVQQQQASLRNAEANLRRTQQLVAQGFMSRQAQDDADARVNVARAAVAASEARVAKARAALTTTGDATPAVRIAQAEVEKARLDLEHTVVRASEPGVVTHFDLAAGTVVTPGNPLFALVVERSFWVDANFKETELGGVQPGLPAEIVVDLYPKHPFHGHVESLAGGTGAAFSLLPPQNATGNWVKVAQRVPVRITVDDPDPQFPLRVGATATVSVDLRATPAPVASAAARAPSPAAVPPQAATTPAHATTASPASRP